MTVKFDMETIRVMTIFENLTGAKVKDCVVSENSAYIVVEKGMLGIAIGKNGSSVRRVEKALNKTIKLFEFSDDLKTFVKNLIPNSNSVNVRETGGRKTVEVRVSNAEKPIVIGREGKNLKILKELVKRSHEAELIIR